MSARQLKNMPSRVAKLPVSSHGFPVPFFATWIDGEPDFRVVEADKMARAVKFDLCWICGEKLGVNKAFVIGPMCGISRTISDPPSHPSCAEFAAINCPFLANPQAKRNERGLPDGHTNAPGLGLKRNPGATAVWIVRRYSTFKADKGILFDIGEPEIVKWFANGREATRDEIDHSVATGLPSLTELATAEGPRAVAELERRISSFTALLDESFQRAAGFKIAQVL
jgi:hypothetical protein